MILDNRGARTQVATDPGQQVDKLHPFAVAQTLERFRHHHIGDQAQFGKNRMGTIGQVQAPGAAVGRVGAAFDKPGFGEAIDHPPYGDGLDVERFGKAGLVDAFGPRQDEQHLPLRPADAQFSRTRVEAAAQQPSRIGNQDTKAVRHADKVTSLLVISYLRFVAAGWASGARNARLWRLACATANVAGNERHRTWVGANPVLLTNVGLVSHFIAAIAFFGLGLAAMVRQHRRIGYVLAIASFLTSVWAVVFVLAARGDVIAIRSLTLAETVRTTAWIGFLLAVLRRGWQLDERGRLSFLIATGLGFAVALQLVLDALGVVGSAYSGPPTLIGELFVISRLTVAMVGLVMAHNLYLQSATSGRAGGRMLAIGVGGILVYDLNLYTLAFLLPPVSPDLFNIRGAANTLTAPLLLLAAREAWVARVQVSRQVVFHTLSFSMIGFYLIAMAALAYGLRLAGGDWGLLLQVSFLFASAIIGVVVLFSPRFRAALRVQIAKNFFTYKYDYRQEWPRFIATVSQTGSNAGTLQERVIQAVCAVVESPGGVLFIPDEVALTPAAEWQMRATTLAPVPNDGAMARFLAVRQRVIDFDEMRADVGSYGDIAMPWWAVANRRIWLGVPLIHLDTLAGFLVIERSLVDRSLNWEDFELLRTLGRQAASYIAESSTQEALDEAGKFEEFNRRFAFIIHDIKNLVSQLSLVARNAERHADNPAFRADMVATLQSSVGKMNDLLARLAPRATARTGMPTDQVDLVELLGQVAAVKRFAHPILAVAPLPPETRPHDYVITGDPGRIEQLLLHLVQNAIDASAAEAPIDLSMRHTGDAVVVTIADKGEGMSQRFIAQDLFRPFRSTKTGGFGIGAYEAREIARAHGGRLEVDSREGVGTVFRIVLPVTGTRQSVAAR